MKIERFERRRTVLMLQGPASGFWSELARAFDAAGFRVIHVPLAAGDRLYWRGPGELKPFRGHLDAWESWLERLITVEGVQDVIYYGDRLPYHIAAQRIAARRMGLRAWVVELGYLRPDWITLEPFAMGRNSRFPRDPRAIMTLAAGKPLPDETQIYSHAFAREAVHEVCFNMAHLLGRRLFPDFDDDRSNPAIQDYIAWIRRIATRRQVRKAAKREIRRHLAEAAIAPFAMIALQLDCDYQIRGSSDYDSQTEMLEEVLGSFAGHAPAGMRMLVKLHPHDSGLIDWWQVIATLSARLGLAERVTVIRGGNFRQLAEAAHGVVTTNSTAGVSALAAACPVKVMGSAVYDVPGMTHQASLDSFWTAPERPDMGLVDDWRRAVAAEIQVRGSFHDRNGQRDAAAEIARRVMDHQRYWQLHEVEEPEVFAPLARAAIA